MESTSSAKNTTYSRRRESIEDHLAQARRCGDQLGIRWTAKLGSIPFVESLIRKGIIAGPKSAGAKAVGPGVAQRFHPRDLRALLEILRSKSHGAKHPQTWILLLWLRGRDYDLALVRAALRSDMKRIIKKAKRAFSKTDRFTGSFTRRYRRARGAKASKYDEAFKIMSALIVQPTELQNLEIDVDSIATILTENTDVQAEELASLLRVSIDAAKAGTLLDEEANSRWFEVAQRLPGGTELLKLMGSEPSRVFEMVNHAYGAVDDGFGISGLVRAAHECTDAQLLQARRWHQAIRFNKMGQARTQIKLVELTSEQRSIVEWMYANHAMMRQLIRQGADESILVLGIILNDELPAKTPDWRRKRPDINGLLAHLRNEKA